MGSHVRRQKVVMGSHVGRHRVVIDSHVGRQGSSVSSHVGRHLVVKCSKMYEVTQGHTSILNIFCDKERLPHVHHTPTLIL
eukprot:scaffold18161_cov59-Cyclotella_meneghiniana.AAC.1